jgi:hypothetical protein
MNIAINAKKCATLTIVKGKVVPSTHNVDGVNIPTLDVGDHYTYLGKDMGIAIDQSPVTLLKKCIEDLNKVKSSLLSPWQKIDAIKTFILPRLGFILRNGEIPRGTLKEYDRAITKVVRSICKLPQSSTHHYIRSSTDRGGLGILTSLEEQEAQIITHAFRLLTSPVESIRSLAWETLRDEISFKLGHSPNEIEMSDYLNGKTTGPFKDLPSRGKCLWNKVRSMSRTLSKKIGLRFEVQPNNEVVLHIEHPLNSNTHIHADGRKFVFAALRSSIQNYHTISLREKCKDQGRCFDRIGRDKANSKFIADGRYISHASFSFIHAARLNQLAVNAAPGRGLKHSDQDQLCRRCNDGQRETLAHVLCHCKVHLGKAITVRHNLVAKQIASSLRTHFPSAGMSFGEACGVAGRNVKPDIVLVDAKSKKAIILDIRCPFEGSTNSFENARVDKQLKYQREKEAFQRLGYDTMCDAILVGALGSWDPLNDRVLSQCGIKSQKLSRIKRQIIGQTIDVSRVIYWQHILGQNYFHFGRYDK